MSFEPTRRCSGCGEDKYVIGFYKNRCEDCYKVRRKAYTDLVGYQHREKVTPRFTCCNAPRAVR